MLFANGRRAKTLLSCLVLIIANLPLRSEPVAALAYEEYPAPRAQEAVQHLSNERNAPVLSGIRVAQAWWTVAGQRETHDSDSASFGRKQRRAQSSSDRGRRREMRWQLFPGFIHNRLPSGFRFVEVDACARGGTGADDDNPCSPFTASRTP
jgi:hypothetical protein